MGMDFFLIETILWDVEKRREGSWGYWLLDYHLKRLSASARHFGIPFDPKAFQEELDALEKRLVSMKADRQKIRVTLNGAGRIEISCHDLPPPPNMPVGIDISSVRIDSSDEFLYHKTSRRELFDRERLRLEGAGLFETIFPNERNELTQGTITNLFIDRGKGILETPALSCGLLPGTLRQYLLERKMAEETIVTPSQLRDARKIFVGNSLRGLMEAELVNGHPIGS